MPSIKGLVLFLLKQYEVSPDEVILHFVSQKKICALHAEFFDDPTLTDCISFPIDQELLGEIFVCPKTAIEYAKAHKVDPYEETTLYVIHGLLHLLGYDDIKPKDRKIMHKEQNRLLTAVRRAKKLLRKTS